VWVIANAETALFAHMVIVGPVRGDWWRLLTAQFAYGQDGGGGVYAFVALMATGLFGWLLERRYGPAVVLTLYLVAGVTGALAAEAVY
jgi:membrane associated rhomboid family serine protease